VTSISALLARLAAIRAGGPRNLRELIGARMSNIFRAGDKAPCSGLYRAMHKEHAETHEVIILYGEVLPSCVQCGGAVQFALAELSVHVYAHPLFARER